MKKLEWLKEMAVGAYCKLEDRVANAWKGLSRRKGEKSLVEELAERKRKNDNDLFL